MKVYLLSITLIFVFISCNSDINDKKHRNDKWAWWIDAKTGKGQWIPLSDKPTWQNGKYTKFYRTGEVYEIGKIKNGVQLDTTYFYNLNNKVLDYRLIKSNDTSYYFINDGKVKIYNQDKSLLAEGIIQNHTYGDKWIKYYHNGNKEFTNDYVDGTGWEVTYYENGQTQDSSYHQKRFDSGVVFKSWYSNGQISEIANWKDGVSNGAYLKYYENGQIQKSSYFVNGKEEGISKEWYLTGKIHYEAILKNSELNGQFTEYDENERVKKIIFYKNGLLDGEAKEYDANGKLITDALFENGVRIK